MRASHVAAVVAAAGRGERLGASQPKAFVLLAGQPIVLHTLRRLAAVEVIGHVVVAVPESHLDAFRRLVATDGPWPVPVDAVVGGRDRQQSVLRCLEAVGNECEIVVVHDAVRPFVSAEVVRACVAAAAAAGAALAAEPLQDTLKRVTDHAVNATVDRRGLWRAQTPQAFRIALLREAHLRAAELGSVATDDAALVEWAGAVPRIVPGDPLNLKITTAADLRYAERLLRALVAAG